MPTIFKHGSEAALPILAAGEPGFTTDTEKLFIGTGTKNIQINTNLSGSDQSYTHIQSIPATEWNITLPEGFKEFPAVTITDSAGTQVFGEVNFDYPIVTLSFAAGFGGKAHFN